MRERYRRFAAWYHRIICILLLAGLAVSSIACTVGRSPVTGQRRAYGYSWEQERKIGQQSDQQIVATYGAYEHNELQSYVDRVAQRVLEHSDMRGPEVEERFRETPFTFRVLDSPIVNAFALPGGYIYITRGLLAHAKNEAQLAVILGHEIAHVAARHASQRQLQQQLGQIGLIGGAILGQETLGIPAQQILNLGGTAAQLLFLRYSREDERESDDLGVEYAARAGYQVSEGAGFFSALERISEQQQGGLPTWLSSHPDPGDRQQTILELADVWQEKLQTKLTVVNQEELFNHINGIILGDDPRQGYTMKGNFYHPELEFRFHVPTDWRVINQPSQVQLMDPDQQAAMVFQIAEDAGSPREAAQAILQEQGVSPVGSREVAINNMPAYEVVADAQQEGQVYRLLITAIEYNNRIYRFLGYTSRSRFSEYSDAFRQTIQSFDRLTDPELLNVQPTRLRITTADRTATFRELIPEQLPRDLDPQSLAIMNQIELDATIEAGQPFKIAEQ